MNSHTVNKCRFSRKFVIFFIHREIVQLNRRYVIYSFIYLQFPSLLHELKPTILWPLALVYRLPLGNLYFAANFLLLLATLLFYCY